MVRSLYLGWYDHDEKLWRMYVPESARSVYQMGGWTLREYHKDAVTFFPGSGHMSMIVPETIIEIQREQIPGICAPCV